MNKCALNFICKNESHIIREMLDSCRPVTDLIVANDTGSTDETIEIIRDFGAKAGIPTYVFTRPFDDFGSSRNFALDHLRTVVQELGWDPAKTWGFWLDCDDKLEVDKDFNKEALREVRYRVVKSDGKTKFPRTTFYRLDGRFKWKGPIHETLRFEDEAIQPFPLEGLLIHSAQKGKASLGDQKAKYLMYAQVLENFVETKDQHYRWLFHTAKSYYSAAQYEPIQAEKSLLLDKSTHYFERVVEESPDDPDYGFSAQYHICTIIEQLGYSWSVLEDALLKANKIDSTRGEAYRVMIIYYLNSEDAEDAYSLSTAAVKLFYGNNPYPKRSMHVRESFYNWEVLELHLRACILKGVYEEATWYAFELQKIVTEEPGWFSEKERVELSARLRDFTRGRTVRVNNPLFGLFNTKSNHNQQ